MFPGPRAVKSPYTAGCHPVNAQISVMAHFLPIRRMDPTLGMKMITYWLRSYQGCQVRPPVQ